MGVASLEENIVLEWFFDSFLSENKYSLRENWFHSFSGIFYNVISDALISWYIVYRDILSHQYRDMKFCYRPIPTLYPFTCSSCMWSAAVTLAHECLTSEGILVQSIIIVKLRGWWRDTGTIKGSFLLRQWDRASWLMYGMHYANKTYLKHYFGA